MTLINVGYNVLGKNYIKYVRYTCNSREQKINMAVNEPWDKQSILIDRLQDQKIRNREHLFK